MSLTDDDKQWIAAQMSTQIDRSEERLTERIAAQIDRSEERQAERFAAQMAAQIERSEVRQTERFAAQIERSGERQTERFAAQIERSEERLLERIERVETTLLTEFHKWASPTEMRLRSHSAALRALDAQQEAAADITRAALERIKALERKQPGSDPQA